MRNIIITIAVVLGAYLWLQTKPELAARVPVIGSKGKFEQQLKDALAQQTSNVRVRGEGRIIELLTPESGRKYQPFLIELESGQQVILEHNTEFAEQIRGAQSGDKLVFFGEFDWTARGGVVHSTHEDPKGLQLAGWVKHMGKTYD